MAALDTTGGACFVRRRSSRRTSWLPRILGQFALLPLFLGQDIVLPKHYGDPDFFVKLTSIQPSKGSLKPAFNQDNPYYQLVVRRPEETSIGIELGLDVARYYSMNPPSIQVNGKDLEFNPTSTVEFHIPLNETYGLEDKNVTISIFDPKSEWGFGPFYKIRKMDYIIQILQPPDYERVVMPTSLKVTDNEGHVVQGEPPFEYMNDDLEEITYFVNTSVTSVTVDLTCPTNVGGGRAQMLRDEKVVPMNQPLEIDFSNGKYVERAEVACRYSDGRWVPPSLELEQRYAVIVKRHVMDQPALRVRLMMLPDFGYCTVQQPLQQETFAAWRGDRDLAYNHGFICRHFGAEKLKLVALAETKSVEIHLRRLKRGENHRKKKMKVSVPMEAEVGDEREYYEFEVAAGDNRGVFPVLFVQAGRCSTLPTPSNLARRIPERTRLQNEMCSLETCEDLDYEWCFVPKARCDTYVFPCPDPNIVVHDPHARECEKAKCEQELDKEMCCSAFAPGQSKSTWTTTTTFINSGLVKDDAVMYKGKKALIYSHYVEPTTSENSFDIVVEASGKIAGPIPIKELKSIKTTFQIGETVILPDDRLGIVKNIALAGWLFIEMKEASSAIESFHISEVRKCAECFMAKNLWHGRSVGRKSSSGTSKQVVTTGPADSLYKVFVLPNSSKSSKECDDAMAQWVHDTEDSASISPSELPLENCPKGSKLKWIQAKMLKEAQSPTGYRKGWHVMVNGQEGILRSDCGGQLKCVVAWIYSSAVDGLVEPADVGVTQGFSVGQGVFWPSENRGGVVREPCGPGEACSVDFSGGSGEVGQLHSVMANELEHQEGFLKGERVMVQGKHGKVLKTCLGDLLSLCEVTFADGSTMVNVHYEDIVKEGFLLPGDKVQAGDNPGYIIERRSRATYNIEFKTKPKETPAPITKGTVDPTEVRIHCMEEGDTIKRKPLEALREVSMQHEWNFLFPKNGTGMSTADLSAETLGKGTRVLVAGRLALIYKMLGNQKVEIIYQDDNKTAGPIDIRQVDAQRAQFLVGDRVRVYDHVGTIFASGRVFGHSYQVSFDVGGESSALAIPEMSHLRETFKKGDHVLANKCDSVVTDINEDLEAIYAECNTTGKISGPWKPYQLRPLDAIKKRRQEFRVGDEVVAYGLQAVVKSPPDEDGMCKVIFFDDGNTYETMEGQNLQSKIGDLSEEGNRLPTFSLRHMGGEFDVGDKVLFNGVRGVVIGTADIDTEPKYPVRLETGEVRHVAAKELELSKFMEHMMHMRIEVGDKVMVQGKHGFVSLGPDSAGRFMVTFIKTGKTQGPYVQDDLVVVHHLGEEVLVDGQNRGTVTKINDDGSYQVQFKDGLRNPSNVPASSIQSAAEELSPNDQQEEANFFFGSDVHSPIFSPKRGPRSTGEVLLRRSLLGVAVTFIVLLISYRFAPRKKASRFRVEQFETDLSEGGMTSRMLVRTPLDVRAI